MNKLLPLIIIVGSLFFAFKDSIDIDKAVLGDTTQGQITTEMKDTVSEIVSVVQKSGASKEAKEQASSLWIGAGDMWAILDINTTSDKVSNFNEDLFLIYTKKYDLSDKFPGFANAADQAFYKMIGEYPKQMTKDDCKKMSDLCYAIAWAFEQ